MVKYFQMNETTDKRKYSDILAGLLRAIEIRDGRTPETVGQLYRPQVEEGMCRESIVQILADEPIEVRDKILSDYPELITPYACRIKFTPNE